MQTRVLQAAGRCTRALQDRSAVFVTGQELLDYFVDERNWKHFHPELQSELAFGVHQSKDMDAETLSVRIRTLIDHLAECFKQIPA